MIDTRQNELISVLTTVNDSLVISKPFVVHWYASLFQYAVLIVEDGRLVVVDVQGIPVVEYYVCLDFLTLERCKTSELWLKKAKSTSDALTSRD